MRNAGLGHQFADVGLEHREVPDRASKVVGWTITGFIVVTLMAISKCASTPNLAPPTSFSMEPDIRRAVQEQQSGLPHRLDNVSTLTRITTDGRTIVYTMRLDTAVPAVEREEFRQRMTALRGPALCQTSATLIAAGAEFQYDFTDPSGFRGTYTINKGVCDILAPPIQASVRTQPAPAVINSSGGGTASPPVPPVAVPTPSGPRPRAQNPFMAP